jgi:MFS family permease
MKQADATIEYGTRRIIITLTAMLCAILELLDTTIVNVALNDLQGNLGATLSEVSWVVTAYGIGNVILIPMTSWLSRQFGRRNYFAAGRPQRYRSWRYSGSFRALAVVHCWLLHKLSSQSLFLLKKEDRPTSFL